MVGDTFPLYITSTSAPSAGRITGNHKRLPSSADTGPSKQDNNKTNDVPQETQTETVQVEKPTPRRRKGGSGDYQETYFQKVELADRQPLYVSRTTHEKLMRIVTVIGGRKVTVSSYVENILLRHFEQYQDEINTLYESHFQKPV